MFQIYTSELKRRWVVEDRQGNIYAVRDWPRTEDARGMALQDLQTLVKLANIGDAELKRSEREIARLQKQIDDFKRG